jgi:hypothetical protein
MKRVIEVATAGAAVLALSMGMLTSASAAQPKLSSELLSVGQMPTGWSIYHQASSSGTGCLANILGPKGREQTAKVAFEDNGNSPLLEEAVATYSNAKTAYKKIATTLTNCKSVRGKGITGTVGQMSLSSYGNASEAFLVTLTSKDSTVDDDLLIVRKGNLIMGIQEADVSPIIVRQFQGFVVKALAKVK